MDAEIPAARRSECSSEVSSRKAVRGQQPVGVKEGWFRRRGMDTVLKEDIMVEEKKNEDHLLAVGVRVLIMKNKKQKQSGKWFKCRLMDRLSS